MQIQWYEKLKVITDSYYSGERKTFAYDILKLLREAGIKPRRPDRLHSLQISIPTTRTNSIVVGLRYFKTHNGKNTEDCFLFEKEKPLLTLFKGKIEKLLPEYKDTHHAQLKNADELVPEIFRNNE